MSTASKVIALAGLLKLRLSLLESLVVDSAFWRSNLTINSPLDAALLLRLLHQQVHRILRHRESLFELLCSAISLEHL